MKFQYMFFFKLKQAQLYHEMKCKIQDRIENFSLWMFTFLNGISEENLMMWWIWVWCTKDQAIEANRVQLFH